MKTRVPIRYLTVFGVTALVAVAVGIVFSLGFISATKNTRLLMSDQASVMINSMDKNIALWLRPMQEQSNRIARHILDNPNNINDMQRLDEFMLGALAATEQVAKIALVKPDGLTRRWVRMDNSGVTEDWSDRQEIMEWIDSGSRSHQASWIEPFFTDTIDKTVLLHQLPIHGGDDNLIGMLVQTVSIEELSRYVADLSPREGMTPFILYGKNRVLAHPYLVNDSPHDVTNSTPLVSLSDLGDDVLQRIWSPDEEQLFFLNNDDRLNTSGAFIKARERFYIYLYRSIHDYGEQPWVIGAYLDTSVYGGAETQRLMRALLGSLFVLLAAITGAILLGRYITRPVTDIAKAARLVEENKLSEVGELQPSRMQELDDAARSFNKMIIDLRERALIRQTLGQFVPERIARTLLSEGGSLKPETAYATLLYSDIEGFTAMTESLGSTKIVAILNAYFSAMVDILERHMGVVTQFHGDAVLATFNVPIANAEHAKSAILAATEMLATVDAQLFADHSLRIRIGIDSGTVIAGAVGAAGRLSYTVYGDAVNLAARLQILNKDFGTSMLISENTATLAEDVMPLRAVGETQIRGQSKAIKTYTQSKGSLHQPLHLSRNIQD